MIWILHNTFVYRWTSLYAFARDQKIWLECNEFANKKTMNEHKLRKTLKKYVQVSTSKFVDKKTANNEVYLYFDINFHFKYETIKFT